MLRPCRPWLAWGSGGGLCSDAGRGRPRRGRGARRSCRSAGGCATAPEWMVRTRALAALGLSWPDRSLPAEMHENATEVLGVLLNPVVERLDVFLLKEAQYVFLKLPRSLARDDLDQRSFRPHGFVNDGPQGAVDVVPAVVDVVQVELEFHGISGSGTSG